MRTKLLIVMAAVMLHMLPNQSFGQAPTLGVAAGFVLFTTIGPVTNSGIPYLTHLTGNVGTNTGSSTGFGNVDGQMHDGGPTSIACAADVIALYGDLDGRTPTFSPPSPLLGGGETLSAGVYQYPLLTAASLNLNLFLDGAGDPNALFIIKIDGAFSVNTGAKVVLLNGALACNVFWLVEGMIGMGAGATMRGTMLAHNGQILLGALDTLEGRALSINGEILTNSLMAFTPLGCGSPVLTGPAAPSLVSTASFGVFSSIGPVTSTPVTYVLGDVGSNTAGPTGFDPLNVTGDIYTPGAVTATCAADLLNVYNYMNALPTDIELLYPALFGHDLVLTPHTYHMAAAPISLTGSVYLNAQGNPNAVFVINMNGAFITSLLSKIILINGTQAKNVYWKIDGAVHIYDNSVFNGTIIAAGAIDLDTGDTLNGRAMTINGAVAINGSYINVNPAPCVASSITGIDSVCVGMTTLLTSSDTGRIWHSSDTSVATIDSVSGLVTGVSAGTTIITLTTGLACQNVDTVTVNAAPLPVTGADTVCAGSSTLYSSLTTGGTWSSSNLTAATVGSLSGLVSGIAAGTADISYTIAGGCSAMKNIVVNSIPAAGTITGTFTVCPAANTLLSNTTSGGIWSSVTPAIATIGSLTGLVTGVVAGTTTISYTVTNTCGASAATTIVTVNPAPDAGTITGIASTCPTGTTTLSNTAIGGVWSSVTPAIATIGSLTGIVTGIATGTTTISYTVTNSCGTAAATVIVTVSATPDAGTITGTTIVCENSNTTLSSTAGGGIWSSSTPAAATIGSASGIVTGIAAGTTTISYTVTNSCGTNATATIVTVNPLPVAGTITGIASTCPSGTTTLSNTAIGGVWSSVTPAIATIGSITGIVTGITAGTTTISYTVTNSCGTAAATRIVTVSATPDAGTIAGTTIVCAGSTTTLTNTAGGGVWSSVTPAIATIGSASGIVTGMVAGTSTISYSVTNSCGTNATSTVVTVDPLPIAGTITGTASTCPTGTTTLSNTASGGVWSSVTPAIATIGSLTGIVSGVTTGTTTISYTVTNSCGTAAATVIVTISATPDAGTITGTAIVCAGSTTTLTNTAGGGVWSSVTPAIATIGSASGIVTGMVAGTSTISYSVTNSCGTIATSTVVTVNPLPVAGTITGTASTCPTGTTTLSNTASGGVWSSVTPAIATIGSLTGIVTGIATGTTTISYTVTNSCGTAVATVIVTISATPDAGTITGTAIVCAGSTTTLTNTAGGGVWSSVTPAIATIGSASGIVTGMVAGTSTISYSVTNSCGTNATSTVVTVDPLPIAGTITGTASTCPTGTTTLSNTASGGVWSSVTPAIATIGSLTGIVTGVTTGTTTISYTVINSCGTVAATRIVTVSVTPDAGTITGTAMICAGSTTTLTNTVGGGVWVSVTPAIATIGSASGIVTGMAAGTTIVSYTVTNSCGSASSFRIVTVNPLPFAGIITGTATVCQGNTITLNSTVGGGIWTSASTLVAPIGSLSGIVTGANSGTALISYSFTNICGTNVTTRVVTVSAMPNAGTIVGLSRVCTGSSISLANIATGGIWSTNNANTSIASGLVTGIFTGIDTIVYTVTNSCGSATAIKIITVNPLPGITIITTSSPAIVCNGTMYQNFGTSTPVAPDRVYNWSAVNATVWAQGSSHNYALVNFNLTGTAYVTLNTTISSTGCTSTNTQMVTVNASPAQVDYVSYFKGHFVCTPNGRGSYQWGYDDKTTLDSTILVGEINQDYVHASPDFNNRLFWVMTNTGGCIQKTYYTAPLVVESVSEDGPTVKVYPNPASSQITVEISANAAGTIVVEIANIMGQKMTSVTASNSKAVIDVTNLAAGPYIVTCYNDGIRINSTRFIKN